MKEEPWLKLGRSLQEHWNMILADFRRTRVKLIEDHVKDLFDQEPFIASVIAMNRGDPSYLVTYLRSDRPITESDRAALADYFEGRLQGPARQGRPLSNATEAAAIAKKFYGEWKQQLSLNGIKFHGLADPMKIESARFVVEDYLPELRANLDTVIENMERAKSRQK